MTDEADTVDVVLKDVAGDVYQFLHVSKKVLDAAFEKAVKDGTTFSMTNLQGAAIVVPWRVVRSVACLSIFSEDHEDLWTTLWERPAEEQVA